jgi:rhodanese-related sulfurtransferase
MAKKPHQQPPQQSASKSTMILMSIGGLLVAGLVVWALTRTVETPSTTSSIADAAPQSAPVAGEPQTTTESSPMTSANSPMASATAPLMALPTSTPQHAGADFPRISAEDLYEKWKAGSVTIIDVRDAGGYEAAHIPGSMHIPLSSVEANLDRLSKDKEIVAVCTCPAEESAIAAGQILNQHGYTKVTALFGGLVAWRNLGYKLDKGPEQ